MVPRSEKCPTLQEVVGGIYPSRLRGRDRHGRFSEAGFLSSGVSVLLPENLGPKELTTEKSTKAPEGVTAGATSGVLIGGAVGWLVGIGALAIPGLGPFIAAGPLMATLAGLGVGGVVGGIAGALIGVGIPEYEGKRYEGRLAKGDLVRSTAISRRRLRRPKTEWRAPAARTFPFRPEETAQAFGASGQQAERRRSKFC